MDPFLAFEENCPAEIAKFRLLYFHVISPNVTKYTTYICWIKRFYKAKRKKQFRDKLKCRIARIEVDNSS